MCRVFYKGKGDYKKARILSFGVNQMSDIYGKNPGIHAEQDAINKLKPMTRNKHLKIINMLVIRISKTNKISNSKPCTICINNIKTLPEKKGYRIKNIYYSNEYGEIIKSNIKKLESEEPHYSMYYKTNRNLH